MASQVESASGVRVSPLASRLEGLGPLGPAGVEAVRACRDDPRLHPPGSAILAAEAGRVAPRLILGGWAGWAHTLADGRRQILQLHLAGDVLGLFEIPEQEVVALTTVRSVDATPLMLALQAPGPAGAALRSAWADVEKAHQRGLVSQLVRLGCLSAYERMANLIFELLQRHRRAGLGDGRWMPWGLTQETVADVLGLSVVHVNRTLQQLRRDGLVVLQAGRLSAPDPERLAAAGRWEGER
jgi:CRP-like cAMP-binding protein